MAGSTRIRLVQTGAAKFEATNAAGAKGVDRRPGGHGRRERRTAADGDISCGAGRSVSPRWT